MRHLVVKIGLRGDVYIDCRAVTRQDLAAALHQLQRRCRRGELLRHRLLRVLRHGRDQAGRPAIGAYELIELDLDDRFAHVAQSLDCAGISLGDRDLRARAIQRLEA
jgi:hypothetical protein